MCLLRQYKKKIKVQFIDMDIYKNILNQVSDRRRFIHLNNIGEPLLNPNFLDIVAMGKERNHHVSFCTNGSMLNKKLADELLKLNVDFIGFSVEGLTKETFESIRVGANYEKVVDNIRYYSSKIKDVNPDGKTQVQSIISNQTLLIRDDFENFWKQYVDNVIFMPLHDWNQNIEVPGDFDYTPATSNISCERFACPLLWATLIIGIDGRPLLCSYDNQKSNLSNTNDRPLQEIWENEISLHRRDQIEDSYSLPPCSTCDVWPTLRKYW